MITLLAGFLSPEVLIVAGVIVLLFGGSQLPKLARSIGEAKQEFEKSQKGEATEDGAPPSRSDDSPDGSPPQA